MATWEVTLSGRALPHPRLALSARDSVISTAPRRSSGPHRTTCNAPIAMCFHTHQTFKVYTSNLPYTPLDRYTYPYNRNCCGQRRDRQSCSVFVTTTARCYGLHIFPSQLVPVVPPSAWATVGMTRVFKKRTAAPRTSSTRFTVVFSLYRGNRP